MSLLKACLSKQHMQPLVHINDYKQCMKGGVVCPQCNGDLVAKMGFRNVHHFAHKSSKQCDSWWLERCAFATRLARPEPMTSWHKGWQDLFDTSSVEVLVTCNEIKHIADVAFDGHILEVQHSQLSATDVKKRETFYTTNGKSLTWIVDGRSEKDCIVLGVTWDGYAAIWGAYAPGEAARRSWWWVLGAHRHRTSHATSNVLIDSVEGLFKVICYSDKRVGLAIRVTDMSGYGVTGGLTPSGAQSLQNCISSTTSKRQLTTTITCYNPVMAESKCSISGDTYPHKELLKTLGMTWSERSGWCKCHDDRHILVGYLQQLLTRNSHLWHSIAKQIWSHRSM